MDPAIITRLDGLDVARCDRAAVENALSQLAQVVLPLCNRRHHAAHEGGWQLHLDPTTRRLTITHPETTTQSTGPPQARAA